MYIHIYTHICVCFFVRLIPLDKVEYSCEKSALKR